jgi:1,4-dihydroxy-6-naphthoate synthase
MRLTLGFSPCPNDTFIFDALVNNQLDTQGYEFDVVMEDVESLNQMSLSGKLDITKISFPAFFQTSSHYALLDSGAALGKGVGPLLISRIPLTEMDKKIEDCSIAIPGINTTANMLLSSAFPKAKNKNAMIFSSIENAVLNGTTDLGVIIHENRFTYLDKGLHKLADLGEIWEQETGFAIPLGGIVAHKRLGTKVQLQVQSLIRKSLEFSFSKYPYISTYVKQHSQEMSEEVMKKHIDLYVNDYTLSLGTSGQKAVLKMFEIYRKMNPRIADLKTEQLFIK